ncbi:hypothetical protein HOLleu_25748 [Holothuria leucospilota]|uniref:G domain-containing protein n=1 Tax=Holothuria leucospilota TaxID=206669 RepID=A0A9Q1H4R2_HOLLE|nr:hypothetical protein HOLleu_25748 [Holothuria leucospilota]
METLRIMSVGRSGVGKSTIGNMLLFGKGEGAFATSTSSKSCTQDAKTLSSYTGDCIYIDVPGIPDTNPKNTAVFYDKIIKEAKKELNVLLFVFKREREDPAAYKLAEMLFRELNRSNAAKILVINDHNNYKFKKPPTEFDYEGQAKRISQLTKIDFTHTFILTAETMEEKLKQLKIILSKTKSYKSDDLKTFKELTQYVNYLRDKKNYEKEVIAQQNRVIDRIQRQLNHLQAVAAGAAAAATAATIASFFTFGATLGIATPTTMAAAAATTAIQIKKAELQKAKEKISTENLKKAAQELEKACEQFNELKKALDAM